MNLYAPSGKVKRSAGGKVLVLQDQLTLAFAGLSDCGCVAVYKFGAIDLSALNGHSFCLARSSGCTWALASACNITATEYANDDCTGSETPRTCAVNLLASYDATAGEWTITATAIGGGNPFQDVVLFYGTVTGCPVGGTATNDIACTDSGALAESGTAELSWCCA